MHLQMEYVDGTFLPCVPLCAGTRELTESKGSVVLRDHQAPRLARCYRLPQQLLP